MNSTYVIRYRPAKSGDAPSPEQIRELRRNATFNECRSVGMGNWDGEMVLLPGAWIDAIPDDLEIESITGKIGNWVALKNDDTRMGMLALGWRPRAIRPGREKDAIDAAAYGISRKSEGS